MVVAKTAMFEIAGEASLLGLDRRLASTVEMIERRSCPGDRSARAHEPPGRSDTVSIKTVESFDFVHRERVRFRDVDAMGHVNNAVFATYVEQARIEYLRHVALLDGPLYMGMILARLEIDFVAPAEPGGEIEIGVRPSRTGSKSFELEYALRQGEREVARARTVLVAYDYERGASTPLPDHWRDRLAAPA
jgi:acyl-CoA thioester hydrolase